MTNRFLFLDLETTGLSPKNDRIVEVAAVLIEEGKEIGRFESLVNPETPIPLVVQMVTGITENDIRSAPSFLSIAPQLSAILSDCIIVGHNISFDIAFLREQGLAMENTSIDTCSLAAMILPEQPSYALEALSDALSIEHKYRHRAMGDVLASIDLWNILLEKALSIPEANRSVLSDLFSKSQWVGKRFFELAWEGKVESEKLKVESYEGGEAVQSSSPLQGEVGRGIGIELTPSNSRPFPRGRISDAVLIDREISLRDLWNEAKNDSAAPVIVASKSHIQTLEHESGVLIVDSPEEYLDLEKCEQYAKKSEFSDVETVLLGKIALHLDSCDGHIRHFGLQFEEYPIWYGMLSSADLLRSIPESACIVPYSFFLRFPEQFSDRQISLFGAEMLPEEMENISTERASHQNVNKKVEQSSKEMASKWDMFWGMLGQFVISQSGEGGAYGSSLVVTEATRKLSDWQQFASTLEELLSSTSLDEKTAQILHQFFAAPKENRLDQLFVSADGFVSLSRTPISISQEMEQVWAAIDLHQISLFCRCTSDWWKRQIALPEQFLPLPESEINGITTVISSLPPPNAMNFVPRLITELRDMVSSAPHLKRQMVLCPSLGMVSTMLEQFFPYASGAHMPKLIAQSGGKGKMTSALLSAERSLFFGTTMMLDAFDAAGIRFDRIILLKIPFPAPQDPLFAARFGEMKNSFSEASLPIVSWIWQRIVAKLLIDGGEVVVMDSRCGTQEYGKEVMMGLPKEKL